MLVGVLGLGSIGDRHARNLMNLGHQVIVHDPAILGSVPRDQLIKMSDAVIICTPTKQHAKDLADVLKARKHVLVEKPIGYDCPPFIAGLIMGAKSVRPDIVVATGFNLRFHECVKKAKSLLDNGHLGKLKFADFDVRQRNNKPVYLRDGVIRNWMSHEIDLARYLLGNLHVDAMSSILCEHDQDISASFDFAAIEHDDVLVQISADYLASPEIRRFGLIGEEGTIACDLVSRTIEWGPTFDFSGSLDNKYEAKDSFDENYIEEMQAFINAIEGKDAGPLADGADGVAALQLVMDARKKAELDD